MGIFKQLRNAILGEDGALSRGELFSLVSLIFFIAIGTIATWKFAQTGEFPESSIIGFSVMGGYVLGKKLIEGVTNGKK